jgi:hypothetical protein
LVLEAVKAMVAGAVQDRVASIGAMIAAVFLLLTAWVRGAGLCHGGACGSGACRPGVDPDAEPGGGRAKGDHAGALDSDGGECGKLAFAARAGGAGRAGHGGRSNWKPSVGPADRRRAGADPAWDSISLRLRRRGRAGRRTGAGGRGLTASWSASAAGASVPCPTGPVAPWTAYPEGGWDETEWRFARFSWPSRAPPPSPPHGGGGEGPWTDFAVFPIGAARWSGGW